METILWKGVVEGCCGKGVVEGCGGQGVLGKDLVESVDCFGIQ